MNRLNASIHSFDRWQQQHPVVGFPLAVVKKYSDDKGGYLAALMAYYGFLSLFPMLLVLVTVLHILFSNNTHLQSEVTQSVTAYFPLLGRDLQHTIQSSSKTGLSLVVGGLIILYGARGAADALRFAMDNIWQVPKDKRAGFPKNMLRSFGLMGIAALGFAATASASVFTSQLGHAVWVKVFLNVLGFIILAITSTWAFRVALSRKRPWRKLFMGGLIAAGVIQPLLSFGGILVSHQLKHLDSLYGTFAIVLGLLFWIYLLAQVVIYAIEISAVQSQHLWPRALDANKQPTAADQRARELAIAAAVRPAARVR